MRSTDETIYCTTCGGVIKTNVRFCDCPTRVNSDDDVQKLKEIRYWAERLADSNQKKAILTILNR